MVERSYDVDRQISALPRGSRGWFEKRLSGRGPDFVLEFEIRKSEFTA